MQVSIILRGANDFMLDEVERSLHDALCIVKRTLESNMVEPSVAVRLLAVLFVPCINIFLLSWFSGT
jgi:chaperonin GroEL (HSP60 family)